MKKWLMIIGLMATYTAFAAVVGGLKGGKLLQNEAPRAEFFVNAERKVEVRFYDDALAVVTPTEQSVTIVANAPSGKKKFDLQKAGDALISSEALPEGDGYLIVVQITAAPGGKPQNFRIPYHAGICGECNRAEYACTCEHSGEDDHGH